MMPRMAVASVAALLGTLPCAAFVQVPPISAEPLVVCGATCVGDHLQGMATDGESLYWGFGTEVIKTDLQGNKLATTGPVRYHHGDPCVVDGVVYVPRHVLNTGYAYLGIQSVTYHDGLFYFGWYAKKTAVDPDGTAGARSCCAAEAWSFPSDNDIIPGNETSGQPTNLRRKMHMNAQGFSRRGFLKGALAAGGVVATSRLPLHARGNFEQLSVAYAHINAGAEKPFSVLHISDTHLTFANPDEPESVQKYRRIRTELFGCRQFEALKDSIRWAKINTDYLIHTGDLMDFVSDGNLVAVREAFGPDAGSVFGSIGNHEYWKPVEPSPSRADLFAECSKAYPYNLHFGSQVINGVNFVSIDDAHDDVTQDQVEAFAKEVKKGLPIILLMHVPFYTPRIVEATRKYWAWNKKYRNEPPKPLTFGKLGQEFIKYLRSEPLLKGILAGHEHITVQERFSQTAMQYLVAGNFAFAGREVLFT